MARFIWSQAIVVVLGIGLSSGCKSSPDAGANLESLAKQSQMATQGSQDAKPDGSSYSVYQSPSEYITDSSGEDGGDVNPVTATGHVDRLRNAAHSIKGALQIEPHVVPAADPTRLRHNPGPIQPQLFLSAAALCEQNGQLVQAADQYKRLLALDPKNRSALIGLGRLNHQRGALVEAINVYTRASQYYANDPVILNDLGLVLARAGRTNEAMATLQKAIQLNPKSTLYRNNLAAVMVESDRPAEAVALLEPLHGAAAAHYNVAYLLRQRGDVQAAAGHFGEALRIDPNFDQARQMLNQMTPQIGTRPLRRTARPTGLRTGMVVPDHQPVQMSAPIVPKIEVQPAPVVRAVNAPTAEVVPVTHVEPLRSTVNLPAPVQTPELGIRLPMPRRTLTNQRTLSPPSPSDLPSARTVNSLPVSD